jgi:hypothetical protein
MVFPFRRSNQAIEPNARHYSLTCFTPDSLLEQIVQTSLQNLLIACLSLLPSLWSSGQSSCLQIQRSAFDSRRYQIFWEVMGLERGPLSLVSTIEELLERKSSSSGLESREYGRTDPSRWPRGFLYPQKLALTSPTSGGCSVGIVGSRIRATVFSLVVLSVSLISKHGNIIII